MKEQHYNTRHQFIGPQCIRGRVKHTKDEKNINVCVGSRGTRIHTFLLAIEKISLILAAPLFSLSVNSAPDAKIKGSPLCFEIVLANSVLPVPGGPEISTP